MEINGILAQSISQSPSLLDAPETEAFASENQLTLARTPRQTDRQENTDTKKSKVSISFVLVL